LLTLLGVLVVPAGLLLAFVCVASLACRAIIEWGGIATIPTEEG
jgi:hypothetical protein